MKLSTKALLFAGIPLLAFGLVAFGFFMQGKPDEAWPMISLGVIVAALLGGALLYWIDSWSLKKQSLMHFLLMLVTVLPALIISGWFPLNTPMDWVILIGGFLLGGAILWPTMYFIFGRNKAKATPAVAEPTA